jgi:hypothetical protein
MVQSLVRAYQSRQIFLRHKKLVTQIQCAWRGFSSFTRFHSLVSSSKQLQAHIRMLLARLSRWRFQKSAFIIHRFMRWQKTSSEASFNRRVFLAFSELKKRSKTRDNILVRLSACAQAKKDEMKNRIRRIELRAKAQGMDVRPGDGRRFMEIGMFCTPPKPRASRSNAHENKGTNVSLSMQERRLMDKEAIDRDKDLKSCFTDYLRQLVTVLQCDSTTHSNELRIAHELKMRARENIEMIWGMIKTRSQRRRSLY